MDTKHLPSKLALANQLRNWAAELPDDDPRSRHARLLAEDLNEPARTAAWSRIDLHAHFDRHSTSTSFYDRLSTLLAVSYLAPIIITWYHLRGAIAAFSSMPASDSRRDNFLSFWVGVGGAGDGFTTLGSTAFQLLVALGIIAGLHVALLLATERSDARLNARRIEIDRLLSDCSVYVNRVGAVTPEQVAGALQTSAKEIESAVHAAATSLSGISDVATKITQSGDRLVEASNSLHASTTSMAQTAQRIEAVPSKVSELLRELGSLERTIGDTVTASSLVAAELTNVGRHIEGSLDSSKTLIRAQEAISGTSDSVQRSCSDLLDTVERISAEIKGINALINETHRAADRHLEDFVVINTTGEQLLKALEQLDRIGQQFERAADEFNRLIPESVAGS